MADGSIQCARYRCKSVACDQKRGFLVSLRCRTSNDTQRAKLCFFKLKVGLESWNLRRSVAILRGYLVLVPDRCNWCSMAPKPTFSLLRSGNVLKINKMLGNSNRTRLPEEDEGGHLLRRDVKKMRGGHLLHRPEEDEGGHLLLKTTFQFLDSKGLG